MAQAPDLRSEGDLNLSPRRKEWADKNVSPEAKQLLEEDAKYFLHQSLSTPCLHGMKSSRGASFTNIDGKQILDFHGNYLHNTGFGHPKVIEAITAQMQELSFCTRRYTNQPAVDLAKKLVEWTDNKLSKLLLAPGGAEAISMSVKIARMATGRYKTISMWDSFHGATLDAISLGGEAIFRNGAGPLMPGTEHAPPPNPPGCPFKCGDQCNTSCAGYIEYMLEKEGDVAAVIAETVRSSPFIPPKEYWQRIRKACDKHGALLILDEIPHALGRTGKPFTYQHYDIVPDMVVIGKGLGGGIFPLAAVIAKEKLNEAIKERAIGHFTHEKSPVASAAALAMMQVVEEEHLFDHVQAMSSYSMQKMLEIKARHEIVHDVRALGLLMGIELRNPDTKEMAGDTAEQVMYRSLELGLNFKLSMGCIINLTPPMNITREELETAFGIIDQALTEL